LRVKRIDANWRGQDRWQSVPNPDESNSVCVGSDSLTRLSSLRLGPSDSLGLPRSYRLAVEVMMKKERILALLKLIEGLPLRQYEAPDAVEDFTRRLGITDDKEMQEIAKIVRLGVEIGIPGETGGYLYGHGILLRKHDRDKLIKCLRSLVSGKRGRPQQDNDDKSKRADEDCQVFRKLVAEFEATSGKRGAKTRAYEILEKKWRLTNRGVRARVREALKHEIEIPF
jgi:hypothetical protein